MLTGFGIWSQVHYYVSSTTGDQTFECYNLQVNFLRNYLNLHSFACKTKTCTGWQLKEWLLEGV